ncbi:MAG: AMP-binding protein, partial [Rhodospirillaceae bacterium]|nr:AMP-binding protein [Rhodospirillaceae bacterium]
MTKLIDFPRHDAALAKKFRDAGFWNDDTLSGYLEKWAAETPNATALVAPEREISYVEWRDQSRRFANALLDLGLERGDVVAIQYPNHPEFLIAFLGVAMMGGVLCTLHMPYRAGEMAPLLNHGGARAIICVRSDNKYDAPETMESLKAKVPTLEHIIVAGDAGAGQRAL